MIKNRFYLITLIFIFSINVTSNKVNAQTITELNTKFVKYYNATDWGNACKYGEKLKIQVVAKYGKQKSYATVCYNLAVSYRRLGNFTKAEALFIENKQLKGKLFGTSDPSYASTCYSLAELYYNTGKYKESELLNIEAKDIREKVYGTSHLVYALSCSNLGNTYLKMGNYTKAEPLLITAINIEGKNLGNSKSKYLAYAKSFNNLAVLYYEIGKYQLVEGIYIDVLNIYKKIVGELHPFYAGSCNNLGAFYLNLGNYKNAEAFFIEAKNIYGKVYGKNHSLYAVACSNLAKLYDQIGNYAKAELLYIEAMEIAEKTLGKQHPDYAYFLVNLGSLHENAGNYQKAEPFYIEAKKTREKTLGKQHPSYASSCNNLAALYYKMDSYDKSELLFIEAKAIREKIFGKQHYSYATSCTNLALLYNNMGRYAQAEPLFIEANDVITFLSRESIKFMSEKEREKYLNMQISYNVNIYNSFFLDRNANNTKLAGIVYNNALSIKGQLLRSSSTMRKAVLQSGDTSLISIYEQMNNIGQLLTMQYTLPIDNRRSDINQLEEKVNFLEKELNRKSQNFAKVINSEKNKWQNIQDSLKDDETAIEFINFRYRNVKKWTDSTLYYALILRKDYKYPKAVFLFEEKQLQKLLTRNENENDFNYVKRLYSPSSAQSDSLYQMVFKPIEAYLEKSETLYISATGLLHRIAFDAIPTKDTDLKKTLLSDKYNINYTSSTALILNNTALYQKSIKSTVLFGGITYDLTVDEMKQLAGYLDSKTEEARITPANWANNNRNLLDSLNRNISWSYLPGSLNETKEIQEILKNKNFEVKLYKEKQGSEEQFKALENNAPSIIHVSTHGFYFGDDKKSKEYINMIDDKVKFAHSQNPLLRSGFILAGGNNAFQANEIPDGVEDGVLTASEISKMNLFDTKLVVLSACQTGLGDVKGNEGVYGLQRAFKMAGVDYLLFSLWEVPDYQTRELMSDFYENWFSGMEVRAAFKKGQNQLKTKYAKVEGSAFAWAAFVLMK